MPQSSQSNQQPLFDGDQGFIGFNSRDNPSTLEKGTLSLSQNFRLNRGVAETRKGLKRLTPGGIGANIEIRYVSTYKTTAGVDYIILLSESGLYYYNPITGSRVGPISYPGSETILSTDTVDCFQAMGKLYILRGFAKRPLIWDGVITITAVTGSATWVMPNSAQGIYIANRAILQKTSDEIAISHYLELDHYESMDVFKINDGSNDSIIAIAPWVLNEFVIFMRNRIYYASFGAGAYATGDLPLAADSYVKVLATDIGCVAKNSVAQAAGGMIFLSDGGVYMMTPQSATTPEGMRAGIMGQPLSASIDDIIQRINQNYVSKACGIYFNNRYYLAIPVDGSITNNIVIIYNFVNKQWESIDTFTSGVDISWMVTGLFDGKRRLFFIDKDYGIYLTEELMDGDHYDDSTINAVLPLYLPFTLGDPLDPNVFTRFPIDSKIITRSFNFGFSEDKRYSQVEVDLHTHPSAQVSTSIMAVNPDSDTRLDLYGSPTEGNSTRDLPIRKVCSSCLIKIESFHNQSAVRSLFVTAVRTGNNIRSTK